MTSSSPTAAANHHDTSPYSRVNLVFTSEMSLEEEEEDPHSRVFSMLLNADAPIDLNKLRVAARANIPDHTRSIVWNLLLNVSAPHNLHDSTTSSRTHTHYYTLLSTSPNSNHSHNINDDIDAALPRGIKRILSKLKPKSRSFYISSFLGNNNRDTNNIDENPTHKRNNILAHIHHHHHLVNKNKQNSTQYTRDELNTTTPTSTAPSSAPSSAPSPPPHPPPLLPPTSSASSASSTSSQASATTTASPTSSPPRSPTSSPKPTMTHLPTPSPSNRHRQNSRHNQNSTSRYLHHYQHLRRSSSSKLLSTNRPYNKNTPTTSTTTHNHHSPSPSPLEHNNNIIPPANVIETYTRILSTYIRHSTPQIQYDDDLVYLLIPIIHTFNTQEPESYTLFSSLLHHQPSSTHHPIINLFNSTETLHEHISDFLSMFRLTHPDLYDLFVNEDVDITRWAKSWLRGLLVGQLPPKSLLRLWDVYFSSDLLDLHPFVCLVFVATVKQKLLDCDDAERIWSVLSSLPAIDIDRVVAHAITARDEQLRDRQAI